MQGKSQQNSTFILYLLSITAFFSSLNQNIYSPMIPLIRDSFEVSINSVNLTVSSFIFITAVMQIVLGAFIDSKSQKRLLLISFIMTGVSTIICAFAHSFALFFIARMFQAIGTAMIPLIAVNVITMMFEGEKRGDAMGTYQIALTLAPAIAPILGGILGQYFGYSGVFLFLFAVSMILLVFFNYQFPMDKKTLSTESSKISGKYRALLSNVRGVNMMIVGFGIFFLYFAILTYLPVLLHDHYHVSLQMIGLLYLPLTVSMIIGSILFKRVQRKFALKRLYIVTIFLLPLLIVLFAILHERTLIGLSVSLFLFGVLLGFSPPLLSTMISEEYEEQKGIALGAFNFIRYIGMALGAMVAGIHSIFSFPALLTISGIFLLAVFYLYRSFD